ncbi:MAG: acyl-CoA thioesterase [Candidatus Izemoplasmataceae bacterium]
MISQLTITPRYQETDKMGIIHHSVYPIWYEAGRVKFCEDIGMPFDKIEKEGLYQALIDLKVHYIKSARFNEPLIQTTYIKSMTKLKLTFGYEIRNQEGDLINEGETMLVWLTHELKPLNLAKHHPHIYNLLLKSTRKEA